MSLTRVAFIFALWLRLLGLSATVAHPFDGDGMGPAKAGSSNVQVYLYVEPYTCRVECLVWLPAALQLFAVADANQLVLPTTEEAELLQKARAHGGGWCTLRIDGAESRTLRHTASLVKGMPGRSEVPVKGEPIAVMDAMLGLTWDFEAPVTFEQVEIVWHGFGGEVVAVPVTVSYGPMTEAGMVLSTTKPGATWKNQGRMLPAKPLAAMPELPPLPSWQIPVAGVVWCLVSGVYFLGIRRGQGTRSQRLLAAVSTAVLGGVALGWLVPGVRVTQPWAKREAVSREEAERIVDVLLHNTYRAFDQTSEAAIYDVLARGIHGELLQKLYLQTLKALTLESQDGTRVKVMDLAVQVHGVQPRDTVLYADTKWTVLGNVDHWGHRHPRVSVYKANITLQPVENAWKITGLEVLEETRR